MANTEYKQIPRVQWHTPHFCPLLDVTNTRGGRAKGRTLGDLVIQNFSNMLRAVWDYSRLPMRWVSNSRRAAKQLPGKLRLRQGKTSPEHIPSAPGIRASFRSCSPLWSPQLSPRCTKTNPRREILSGADRGQANAKSLGTAKPRVLPMFSIMC